METRVSLFCFHFANKRLQRFVFVLKVHQKCYFCCMEFFLRFLIRIILHFLVVWRRERTLRKAPRESEILRPLLLRIIY